MTEKYLIAVAWPYANGPLHLGHVAGAYLPADIFARFHRMRGDEVLMVSGSDEHGTPITIRAEQEGTTPDEVAKKYHDQFLESFARLGISWNLFTATSTENHARVAQEIFTELLAKDYIYRKSVAQFYCPKCERYLADRYVEGGCPFCGAAGARGDQCDDCGKPLNALELKDPHCRLCGTTPEVRESEHFFLKLSAFQEPLLKWLNTGGKQDYWRNNVYNFTKSYLEDGLNDRAISRDIKWGVPLPLADYDEKRLYVWFEAVIGYLSAAKEWAQAQGAPEKWRDFWQGDTRAFYFIGKDNIVFHTIIWPAILMGYDSSLNLPYDVAANEFLTIEAKKLSTSRHWAIWLPDYLERYDPDPLRYYLSINMPETNDADFSWTEFVRRNNDELVATYGNLAHRVLTFTYKHFEGSVPSAGELDTRSQELLNLAVDTLKNMESILAECHFREAIRTAMKLAQEANRYLDEKAPWKVIKQDKQAAASSLYVAITVISSLATAMYPFLPFTSEKLFGFLGFSGKIEQTGWKLQVPQPGQQLSPPQPLFVKLDDSIIEEEMKRMLEEKS